MSHPTFAALVEYGDPLTRESYLKINDVDEDGLDVEEDSELPHLFREFDDREAGRVGDVRNRD